MGDKWRKCRQCGAITRGVHPAEKAYEQLRQAIREKLENRIVLANNSPGSILRTLDRQVWKILKDLGLEDRGK
jgi:hypothetical protein